MAYEPVLRLPSNSTIDALAFSSKAEWLASGDHKGHLRIFETTTGIERYIFEFDNPITTVVWHPKKNTVFVGLRTGVVAFIQDFKNIGRQVSCGVKGAEVFTLSFSPSGQKLGMGIGQEVHIATPTADKGFATTTIFPRPLEDSKTGDARIRARGIHFAGRERQMIVSYLNHGIICWDVQSRAPIWIIEPVHSPGFIGYSSISPDGNALCINNLSTGFDIYDLKTRKLHRTLQTPPKADRNVPLGSSFLRGGKTVITASHDGEAKIWNVARGMLVQKLPIAPGSGIRYITAQVYRSRGYVATVPSSGDIAISVWKELPLNIADADWEYASVYVMAITLLLFILAIFYVVGWTGLTHWNMWNKWKEWNEIASVIFNFNDWSNLARSILWDPVARRVRARLLAFLGVPDAAVPNRPIPRFGARRIYPRVDL